MFGNSPLLADILSDVAGSMQAKAEAGLSIRPTLAPFRWSLRYIQQMFDVWQHAKGLALKQKLGPAKANGPLPKWAYRARLMSTMAHMLRLSTRSLWTRNIRPSPADSGLAT